MAFKKFTSSGSDKRFGNNRFGSNAHKSNSRPNIRNTGRNSGQDQGNRQLFEATCSECQRECTVPFRPSSGSPVYCRHCFKQQDGGGATSKKAPSISPRHTFESGVSQTQFDMLNRKLDAILALLQGRDGQRDNSDYADKAPKRFVKNTRTKNKPW